MSKVISIGLFLVIIFSCNTNAQETEKLYLSGTDKDHTVVWEFMVDCGHNSGKWSTIPVPSQWELQGFGTYAYGQDKPYKDCPGEKGLYKYNFSVPVTWKKKAINIVFEGSMTDTRVKINGKLAGPIHRGGFYEFKYNISDLIKYGKQNLLEITVSKRSSNESVNQAERYSDFWIFGGIFRPVYLEVKPKRHIKRVAIDAKANGKFSANIFIEGNGMPMSISAQIKTLDGRKIGKKFKTKVNDETISQCISAEFSNTSPWSPEFPNLYNVEFYLKDSKGSVIHRIKERFGFRTFELRKGDGFYLNGVKIRFKGVNYHAFYPSSGRTTSKALNIKDVNLMKSMKM